MASRDAVLAAMRRRAPVDRSHAVSIEEVVAAAAHTPAAAAAVEQLVAVPLPPPPQTVEEVVARATASAVATTCGLCGDALLTDQDRTIRGRCRHTVHTACLVPLLVAGRQYCMQCTPEHDARTGYAIDTGNDADVRVFTVLEALRFERDKVRDALVSSIAADRGIVHVTSVADVLYTPAANVPRQPGGDPVQKTVEALAARTCRSVACGSAAYCLHRHLVPLSRNALAHWRHYVSPSPLVDACNDVVSAKQAVHRLLTDRVPPSEWTRCGVDAERLAALGFTIVDLVEHGGFLFEDVVRGLALDWSRLEVLHFHPALLANQQTFPVIVLVDEPVSLTGALLMRSFALGFRKLVGEWHLGALELVALRMDACMLHAIGMTAPRLTQWLLTDEAVISRGVQWWMDAFHYTSALHARIFAGATAKMLTMEAKAVYAQLALYTRPISERPRGL